MGKCQTFSSIILKTFIDGKSYIEWQWAQSNLTCQEICIEHNGGEQLFYIQIIS